MKKIELTPDERDRLDRTLAGEFTGVIICFSRCLHCGRRTPHEVCHECGRAFDAGKSPSADEWSRYGHEPEQCADPKNDACRGPEPTHA